MVGYLMRIFNKLPWRRWRIDSAASTTEVMHVWSKCVHDSVMFGNDRMMMESGPWWEQGNERFFDWPGIGDEYKITFTISRVPEHKRQVPRHRVLSQIKNWEEGQEDFDDYGY